MQEKLSQFHVAILIFMTQSGMTIFVLPRLLAQHFGTNGWLALALISIVSSLNILLIAVVYRLGKGKSIFEILEQSIPKFILFPLYIFLIVVWALIACLIAKQFVVIFQMLAFPTTNPMLFKLVFDILAFFLLIKTIYNISKAATVFFWSTAWVLLLMFAFYGDFQWSRLTPFVFQDSTLSVQSFSNIFLAFLGYELYILLFPYVNKQTKLIPATLTGNLLTTINYMYISFIAFGFYGHKYLKVLQYPLLSMFAYIQLPFVQGTENLFYGFFMFSIIITSIMYWWAAKEVSQRIFPISGKWLSFGILLFSYCISYIPNVMSEIEQWLMYLGYAEMSIVFGLPLGLILLLLIQKKRGETSD